LPYERSCVGEAVKTVSNEKRYVDACETRERFRWPAAGQVRARLAVQGRPLAQEARGGLGAHPSTFSLASVPCVTTSLARASVDTSASVRWHDPHPLPHLPDDDDDDDMLRCGWFSLCLSGTRELKQGLKQPTGRCGRASEVAVNCFYGRAGCLLLSLLLWCVGALSVMRCDADASACECVLCV
jgi:hypothetical protein